MKILFLGDFCPTKYNFDLFRAGDTEALFGNALPFLKEKRDRTVVNLECAITEEGSPIRKFGPNLKAPLQTAGVLAEIGASCCAISNNHVLDFGSEGVKNTVSALNSVGIAVTGYGKNAEDSRRDLVFEDGNSKIAVIAVCEHEYSYALEDREGCRPFDEFDTLEDIRSAKKTADRVIVCYHGGKEYCRYPSPRLLKACRAMVKSGADLVLCQHSHCIGCCENYMGGHILYGQGNFHFVGKSEFEGWHSSLAVDYDTETNSVKFTPMVSGERGISLADEKIAEKLLAEFEMRNSELASGRWVLGWEEFCESVRDRYTSAVANAFTPRSSENDDAFFGHYLDCEAHTDVWRQLFKTWHHENNI